MSICRNGFDRIRFRGFEGDTRVGGAEVRWVIATINDARSANVVRQTK